ncbi:MAG: PCP reductase family protein [Leptospirillia bacterium]
MSELVWTQEAEAAMEKVPFFVRGLARRAVLKQAERAGVRQIDLNFVNAVRDRVSPNSPGGPDDATTG